MAKRGLGSEFDVTRARLARLRGREPESADPGRVKRLRSGVRGF